MSLFAGVVALDAGRQLPAEIGERVAGALSRHPGDSIRTWRRTGCFMAQMVLPSETRPCAADGMPGLVTLLAGRPLFDEDAPSTGGSEVERLQAVLRTGDHTLLRSATGSYAVVQWDEARRRLVLLADKVGLRPIYYGVEGGLMYFSSALRVLESIGAPRAGMDVQGVAEIASFGYPLGGRSPYRGFRTIEAAEIVTASAAGVESAAYWHWDRLPPAGLSDEELPRAVFDAFIGAIRRRLGGAKRVVSGLSGGLDSRCVVAGLRHLGVEVHSINFAPDGSEDLAFGRLAAEALGTRHFEAPLGPLDFWDRMGAAHRTWLEATPKTEWPDNPWELWSGDGGSCAMGHIYLNDEIIGLMRTGEIRSAIDVYLRYNRIGLPGKLLARSERERILAYPSSGVDAELKRLQGADPTRRIHLYLMVNGQRRILSNHYENLDLRRFEVATPFFDSNLLRVVLTSPIDGFLHHRFYNRWLAEFPAPTSRVPWQAYPGHEPCPVPKPSGLRTQWQGGWHDASVSTELTRRTLEVADELLRGPRPAEKLIDRRVLWLARRLTGLGIGDYSHVIKCAATFNRYARPIGAAA